MVYQPVLGLLALSGLASAKLVQVHSLVRHGNRAPNAELVDSCPALFPSLGFIYDKFGVRPQALTRMGLNQCYVVGKMLRHQYIDSGFLPSDYESGAVEYHFQARGNDRHQQSLAALQQAMFPIGTGFVTYPLRQQAMPFLSEATRNDPVLHPPKLCQARRYYDDNEWSATEGAKVIQQKKAEVSLISKLCGFDIENARVPSGALKDIADGFGFLLYEGLQLEQVKDWPTVSKMVVDLSFEMFVQRLFGKNVQPTYWSGDYPRHVASGMLNMINRKLDNRGNPSPKMNVYTVSRELVFATEFFFGLQLEIPAKNTPRGAMPPGNALVFELHEDDNQPGRFFVQAWDMFPTTEPFGPEHERQQYKLGACGYDCDLDKFIDIIHKKEEETGTWKDICGAYTFENLTKDFPLKFPNGKPPGKHAPKPGKIGPLPGQDANLDMNYEASSATPNPKYSQITIKPLAVASLAEPTPLETFVSMAIGDQYMPRTMYREEMLGLPPHDKTSDGTQDSEWDLVEQPLVSQQQQAQQQGQAEGKRDEQKGEEIGKREADKWQKKVAKWENMQEHGEGEEFAAVGSLKTEDIPEEERSSLPAFLVLSLGGAMVYGAITLSNRGRRKGYLQRFPPAARSGYATLP